MPVGIEPDSHPVLSGIERDFFDYWLENVVDRDDPHLQRWIDYEEGAVERTSDRIKHLEQYTSVAGKRVLEIGCQNGAWLISLSLAGADPVGIDVEDSTVKAAAVRAACWGVEVAAALGDACNLDYPDDSFDVVASSDVIEHVPDKRAMIREMMRVLRPGGVGVIIAPQRFSLKHLRHDPHYGYAGVSVLPAKLASLYLTKLRGEAVYEVETLPTALSIKRMCRQEGAILLDPPERKGFRAKVDELVDELRQVVTVVVTK